MTDMERVLEQQTVEGEISLVIGYKPGKVLATDVLQAAMGMIEALDRLDAVLLSSVNTSLEPVSVLNDVQHSSLKMLLARALKNIPDDAISNLEWKKWVGSLLVKGKHKLLGHLEADAPQISHVLQELEPVYRGQPGLVGYQVPAVSDVLDALDGVSKARARIGSGEVIVQTELGDISLPSPVVAEVTDVFPAEAAHRVVNKGTEFFKIKSPDLLGTSQWTVIRGNRSVRADMLHAGWLEAYHQRKHVILPGDSLKCRYEETISYDDRGTEIERRLAIVEVQEIVTPPTGVQVKLID